MKDFYDTKVIELLRSTALAKVRAFPEIQEMGANTTVRVVGPRYVNRLNRLYRTLTNLFVDAATAARFPRPKYISTHRSATIFVKRSIVNGEPSYRVTKVGGVKMQYPDWYSTVE